MFRGFTALVLSLMLMCSTAFAGYVEDNTPSPGVGSVGGEWALIGMVASGTATEEVKEAYLNNLQAKLEETEGVLSTRRYTEYSRVVIALNLLEEDALNFRGYDPVTPLFNKENVVKQGINGTAFALIALTGGGYGEEAYRNELLKDILSAQSQEGYFEYGGGPNGDVTAMALCAMAPYTDRAEVRTAVDKAVSALAGMVNEEGLIPTDGIYSSETLSQAIIGLCAVGVDPEADPAFSARGAGLITALQSFSTEGGYAHIRGEGVNPMASEQGLCAMAAYNRFKDGKPSFYYINGYNSRVDLYALIQGLVGVILNG